MHLPHPPTLADSEEAYDVLIGGSNVSDHIHTIAQMLRAAPGPGGRRILTVTVDRRARRLNVHGATQERLGEVLARIVSDVRANRGVRIDFEILPSEGPYEEPAPVERDVPWEARLAQKEREMEGLRSSLEFQLAELREQIDEANRARVALVSVKEQLSERNRQIQADYESVVKQFEEARTKAPRTAAEAIVAVSEAAWSAASRLVGDLDRRLAEVPTQRLREALLGTGPDTFVALAEAIERSLGGKPATWAEAISAIDEELGRRKPEKEAASRAADDARKDLRVIEDLDAGRLAVSEAVGTAIRASVDATRAKATVLAYEALVTGTGYLEELRKEIDRASRAETGVKILRAFVAEWAASNGVPVVIQVDAGGDPEDAAVTIRVPRLREGSLLAEDLAGVVRQAIEHRDLGWAELPDAKWVGWRGTGKNGKFIEAHKSAAYLLHDLLGSWPATASARLGIPLQGVSFEELRRVEAHRHAEN